MKLYPKDIKSPEVVLVLVWSDFWRPCKEGEGKICFCQHCPRGPPCTGGRPWDYAQALRHTGGSGSKVPWHTVGVSSGTSARHSALGSLCPWQLPLHHCLPWLMWPPTYLLSQAMALGPLLFLCSQRHEPTLLHLEQHRSHVWVWWLCWPRHWWEETWSSPDPAG